MATYSNFTINFDGKCVGKFIDFADCSDYLESVLVVPTSTKEEYKKYYTCIETIKDKNGNDEKTTTMDLGYTMPIKFFLNSIDKYTAKYKNKGAEAHIILDFETVLYIGNSRKDIKKAKKNKTSRCLTSQFITITCLTGELINSQMTVTFREVPIDIAPSKAEVN